MPCFFYYFLPFAHTRFMEKTRRQNILSRTWYGARSLLALFADNKFTTIAGTLVFFLVLSFVPLLFFLTLIFGSRISAEQLLELELFDWARGLISYLNTHAEGASAGAGILFLATTFWSSTGFFYHLRRSGEIICKIPSGKKGWKLRLSAVVFAFVIILFLAFTIAIVIGANVLTRSLPRWLTFLVVYLVVTVFGFFGAWILNAYACPYRVTPAEIAPGSALTAVSWLAAALLFRVYLAYFGPDKLYGALSAVIVFLLFLYWLMICFAAGMIYNFRHLNTKYYPLKRF